MTSKYFALEVCKTCNVLNQDATFVNAGTYIYIEKNADITLIFEIQRLSKFSHVYSYEAGVRSKKFLSKIALDSADYYILCAEKKIALQQCIWRKHELLLSRECNILRTANIDGNSFNEMVVSVANSILNTALPEMNECDSLDKILNMWLNGISPGLSKMQRDRYIAYCLIP